MELEFLIAHLQVTMTLYLMERWGVTVEKFVELDTKYDILKYTRLCYEPFHVTGDEGIAEEIEEYIKEQGGNIDD